MESQEIQAARRHLTEVRGLGETKRVVDLAEKRLREAMGDSSAKDSPEDSLESLDISERIIDALRANAADLDDSRLLDPDGLRAWIADGNDLVDLHDIGRKSAAEINAALGIK